MIRFCKGMWNTPGMTDLRRSFREDQKFRKCLAVFSSILAIEVILGILFG